ncbi:MAG: hypothetical protein CL666_13850 [Balneola sp.]|nr:hypothetical protein [Balneola sp.]|tara:strand:- start:541 stop:771 length:231 start_codon:yes stop_codon:yes gene_type:complete
MSKSRYTSDTGLGCGCNNGAGIGSSPVVDVKNAQAEDTKTDLVDTAKKYINGEVPMKYKVAAIALGAGFLWLKFKK